MAGRAGFEAIVPVARWRGFGGAADFNARCFEIFYLGGRRERAGNTTGVIDDTDKDAEAYFKYYVEDKGDRVGVDTLISQLGMNSQTFPPHMFEGIKRDFIAGWGGYQVIGTPDMVADRMSLLPELGIDGTPVVFARFRDDLRRFIDDVILLLAVKGLREAAPAPDRF